MLWPRTGTNLFISIIFFVRPFFLWLFEITAPYKLVNKIDQKAENGGLLGVFFMAFTLCVDFGLVAQFQLWEDVLAMSSGGQSVETSAHDVLLFLGILRCPLHFCILPRIDNRACPKSEVG